MKKSVVAHIYDWCTCEEVSCGHDMSSMPKLSIVILDMYANSSFKNLPFA